MTQQAQCESLAIPPPAQVEMGDGEREKLIEHILRNPHIPSPPAFALQVFQRAGQDGCTIQEIAELLAHDAGLCAKILKTLNSSLYGLSHPVTSVRQAVARLGTRPLRALVLGLALPVMQKGMPLDTGFRRFWRKSVASAVLARELATRLRMTDPEGAMAAGLLCDLGMVLLQQVFPERYRPIWTGQAQFLAEEQCEWEERMLGASHAEVSAALLETWRLPLEILEPIRFHHHPDQITTVALPIRERAGLLDFVSRLTVLEESSGSLTFTAELVQTAHERFGLPLSDLEHLLAEARAKIEGFAAVLGVDIGECPDFDQLLATASEGIARMSVETGAFGPTNDGDDAAEEPVRAGGFFQHVATNLDLQPGSHILQFEILQEIGRGGMGIVLKAQDTDLGRPVALKLLAPELASNLTARKRFALEARFAAALRHENVVTIYAVSEFEGIPFLVMEYVAGLSLGELLENGREFRAHEIANIGRQTALGLEAAHHNRLIHRDVKPANILIEDPTLHARVADFGLARVIDSDLHLSQPGMLVGTPQFMSPEQVDGKPLSAASDLFSLGSVLYTTCTRQLPFHAPTMSGILRAVAEKTPPPIRTINPEIPDGLVHIVEWLQAKNPAERPASAAAVAELLQPWIRPR